MNKQLLSTITLIMLALLAVGVFRYYRAQPTRSRMDDHTLVVGTNAEYPPFSFIKDGTIVGFDIDVAREVAQRLGKELVFEDMPFEMLLPKIQLGDIHFIAAGMTVTPERAKRVLFTKPYFANDPLLIVSPVGAAPINNIQDLNGKHVVVNDGYTADAYISNLQGPVVQRLATPAEAILALRSGRADAYATARSAIQPFFDLFGSAEFVTTQISDVYDNYSLVISSRYPDLLPHVQQALDAMEQDGTLTTLKQRWKLQ